MKDVITKLVSHKVLIIILVIITSTQYMYAQVAITPKMSLNHIHYDFEGFIDNYKGSNDFRIGLGIKGLMRVHKKTNAVLGFNFYPQKLLYEITSSPIITDLSFRFFDVSIGLNYKLYNSTSIGIAYRIEQLYQIKLLRNVDTQPDLILPIQRQSGIDLSLAHLFGKIEVSINLYLNIFGEYDYQRNGQNKSVDFLSHKQLQLGIGFPINLISAQ